MTIDEIKTRYKELRAQANAVYAATQPQRDALDEAEKPYNELLDQIDALLGGEDVTICCVCSEPIFSNEKRASSSDGAICAACAPTYRDIINHPELFLGADDQPMTAAQAKEFCDAHVAAGGNLDDTTAK